MCVCLSAIFLDGIDASVCEEHVRDPAGGEEKLYDGDEGDRNETECVEACYSVEFCVA